MLATERVEYKVEYKGRKGDARIALNTRDVRYMFIVHDVIGSGGTKCEVGIGSVIKGITSNLSRLPR